LECWLSGWLVLLSGLAYPQLTEHAGKHAHHNASTHSTALCSWMCAAGEMLAGVQLVPQTHFDLLAFNFIFEFQSPVTEPVQSPTSRGPPVSPSI
jgi:hypothetical protein